MGLSRVADSPATILELVRMENAFGGNWIKTMNTGGYCDDPVKVTCRAADVANEGRRHHFRTRRLLKLHGGGSNSGPFWRASLRRQKSRLKACSAQRPEIGDHHTREMAAKTAFLLASYQLRVSEDWVAETRWIETGRRTRSVRKPKSQPRNPQRKRPRRRKPRKRRQRKRGTEVKRKPPDEGPEVFCFRLLDGEPCWQQ